MANAVFTFPGGAVVDTSTVDSLRENAAEWLGLATVHQDDAERAAERGDFDIAIKQLQFAEVKIATARIRYADAQRLQREGSE